MKGASWSPGGGEGVSSRPDFYSLLVCVALSLALLQAGSGVTLPVTQALRGSVLRPFLAFQGWMAERAVLRARLETLRQENARLEAELLAREGLFPENRQLRRELELSERAGGTYVPAQVSVGRPRLGVASRFLLDVGRGDGVRPPVGVVTARGLVGVVRSATSARSAGDFWTHQDFRVSVRTRGGGITGIVRPTGDGATGNAMLFQGAPFQEKIPAGSELETTGAGGVYPPGVPVGVVERSLGERAGWSRSYLVRPAVRPQEVRVALVWRAPPDEEP